MNTAATFAIRARIMHRMGERGISVSSLAGQASVPRARLVRRLNAPETFYLDEFERVADALDVPPGWLLCGDAGAERLKAWR